MKFIIFAAVISMMSLNTFAEGQNADKGCHYCTPCKKIVCKDTFVDGRREVSLKREVSSAPRAKAKKANAVTQ